MKECVIGLLLCSIFAAACHAQAPVSRNAMNPDERAAAIQRAFNPTARVDEYKSRIDFDRKFATDDGRKIVAFDWDRLATQHVAGFTALKVENHEQHLNETGPLKDIREYVFNGQYNGARVSITVAQAKDRFRAADYFFNETTSPSTARVPFETDSDPLGTVSVQSTVAGPGRGFVWIYKNLCFVVSGAPADAVRDLSRRLQALAETHTVNSM
ncbi:hypothetical protein [Burkholderia pseudomultivorans]|uniref:Lipoprotein n=1 Tax=Burkholderia pseudomultivorans TaxID=1207504 RepID=A0A6P2JFT2_9BURK|nr:hypothetical protein [Burkholderia pseudomultivorans]MDR8726382.1 hypothetical protein [Burkholderia pseudomultivorans]MDR8733606.1 hypothetical protein [Burkholderia pseudomultivorans]MDR8740132.1 hypothetical protein [Burkholderia pseudomultivorans]MDR8752200.1 hypothetical protein [Burkholderia pseudomultivorans]MDR8776595.1 hypothetical protein [Burkholderia pseudomultivorans]